MSDGPDQPGSRPPQLPGTDLRALAAARKRSRAASGYRTREPFFTSRTGRTVPFILIAVMLVAAVLAYLAGSDSAASGVTPGGAGPNTPVLSLRRVAPVVSTRLADQAIFPSLDQFWKKAPQPDCMIVMTAGGHVVYDRDPDIPMRPASTQKLLTAVALLNQLGGDFKVRTRVMATAPATPAGVVNGDLFLVGDGDPLLETHAYVTHFYDQPQLSSSLEALADALARAGVKHVNGELIADESHLDQLRTVPSWPARYLAQSQVGPMSALSVNDGMASWPDHQKPLTPDGTAADQPAINAATVFRDLLAAKGITVGGAVVTGTAPAAAVEVAGLDSLPLKDMVREMLTESDNQTAELLTKDLGRAKGQGGSTAAGVAVIRSTLAKLGVPVGSGVQLDGSGLDEGNHESCRALAAVLDQGGIGAQLFPLLAVGGKTGTITGRFLHTPLEGKIRAKTGSLNNVAALAGVVPVNSGLPISFAYIQNNPRAELTRAEQFAVLLAGYGTGTSAKQLGP